MPRKAKPHPSEIEAAGLREQMRALNDALTLAQAQIRAQAAAPPHNNRRIALHAKTIAALAAIIIDFPNDQN